MAERTSKQQAKLNEQVARNPQSVDPASSAGLTGHTTEASVYENEDGDVQAIHETTVVTDPNSKLAVQVPDEFENQVSPLNRGKTPNEVIADLPGEPEDSADEDDANAQSGGSSESSDS